MMARLLLSLEVIRDMIRKEEYKKVKTDSSSIIFLAGIGNSA
jgi:hypothetical protein